MQTIQTEVLTQRWKCVPKYTDTDNRCRGQQKTSCPFLIFMLISVIYIGDAAKTALQQCTRDMTKAWTSVLMESVSRDRLTRMYVSSLRLVHSGNKMLHLCHYRRAGAYRVGRTRRPHFLLLPPTKDEVYVFTRIRLSVCQQDYSKTRAWIWIALV